MKVFPLLTAATLVFTGCTSVKPVGALKVASDTLVDGKPLFSGGDVQDRRPYTGHIPEEEKSRGLIQWRSE